MWLTYKHDPLATWVYQEPVRFGETLMVFCSVTAFGKTMQAQLPVMDYRNKAIPSPNAFAVNTAMQRCLVKAIALHGLGLYIYAGEDLPDAVPESAKSIAKSDFDNLPDARQKAIADLGIEITDEYEKVGAEAAYDLYLETMKTLDLIEEQAALKSQIASPIRTAFTKLKAQREKANG